MTVVAVVGRVGERLGRNTIGFAIRVGGNPGHRLVNRHLEPANPYDGGASAVHAHTLSTADGLISLVRAEGDASGGRTLVLREGQVIWRLPRSVEPGDRACRTPGPAVTGDLRGYDLLTWAATAR